LNCGASTRAPSRRISATTARAISGGGIESAWVRPLSSVSSHGSFSCSLAGRYQTKL
jgi:hypothetical protein